MSNGWWRFLVGILIGALAPSLIAWGSMSEKIKHNKDEIVKMVYITTFNEYKNGNEKLMKTINDSLMRIEKKLDVK